MVHRVVKCAILLAAAGHHGMVAQAGNATALRAATLDSAFRAELAPARSNTYTYEAWIYPTVSGSLRKEIFGGVSAGFYVLQDHHNARSYQEGPGDAIHDYALHVGYSAGFGDKCIRFNQWTHVVATYDGTRMIYYHNGRNIGEREGSAGEPLSNSVGAGFTGDGEKMFNLRVWKTARSEDQIRKYALAVVPSQMDTTDDLVWWFPMQNDLHPPASGVPSGIAQLDLSGSSTSVSHFSVIHVEDLAHAMVGSKSGLLASPTQAPTVAPTPAPTVAPTPAPMVFIDGCQTQFLNIAVAAIWLASLHA